MLLDLNSGNYVREPRVVGPHQSPHRRFAGIAVVHIVHAIVWFGNLIVWFGNLIASCANLIVYDGDCVGSLVFLASSARRRDSMRDLARFASRHRISDGLSVMVRRAFRRLIQRMNIRKQRKRATVPPNRMAR